jgi:choline monooxygenase
MDTTYSIDQDISQAETLPGFFYHNAHIFDRMREKIFVPSWQWAIDSDQIKLSSFCYPITLMEGLLDEPIVFVKDGQDKLRCLSNVCPHRGNLVVHHPGIHKQLQCNYHGRRFELDGRMINMPEFQGVKDFPRECDNLATIPYQQWGPLIFAAIAPDTTFEQWIAPINKYVGWLPLEMFKFDAGRSRDYLVRANWALYCENYLEGFHIPFVHASLNQVLDYSNYTDILFEFGTLQVGYAKGSEFVFDFPPDAIDYGKRIAGYYFWLFPNIMFNFYPWGLSLNIVYPLQPTLTKVSFRSYVWKPELLDVGAGAALDRVEREDEAVVEAVQKGLKSRFYQRGRYSVKREAGVHHFHKMLASKLKN